jgi:hypothetical protein
VVKAFEIEPRWRSPQASSWPEINTTLCEFRVEVNGENVTAYVTDDGVLEDAPEIPAYYVAEWIAENWWPLLWEPRKLELWEARSAEDARDDQDFLSRHSILTAEHGFALPSLLIVSGGDKVWVSVRPRQALYAEARFTRSADAWVERSEIEGSLKRFVDGTVTRLANHTKSPLLEAWTLVRDTSEEEYDFCRLMGALGLSPYDSHPEIEKILDTAARMLSREQLFDVCLTSTSENLLRSTYIAGRLSDSMDKTSEIDLTLLQKLPLPADNIPQPWNVGYKAARNLRDDLGIAETDINGATAIFDKLGIDPATRQASELRGVDSPVLGGIEIREAVGRLALIQEVKQHRRFAAARGTYFLWAQQKDGRRLITDSGTRDQQISRAFAAELLVPQRYLRSQANRGRLSWERLREIAEVASVAPDMLKHQALNCGLQLYN